MSTHNERAARLYGTTASPLARTTSTPATSRQVAAERLYGGSGDGYGPAISSYFDRREARLRDDAEGLATSRLERTQVEAFAKKRGIKPTDLHDVLAVVHEHEVFPKSAEAIEKRWIQAFEDLRMTTGGQDNARKLLTDYSALASDLAKEIPSFADRAGRSGAGNDARLVKALAPYGAALPTSTEEK